MKRKQSNRTTMFSILNEPEDETENKQQIIYYNKQQIGHGAFGKIYSITDVKTNEEYALKEEVIDEDTVSHLKYEYRIYKLLQGGVGIPKVYEFYVEKENKCQILIMELLGPSIQKLFMDNNSRFSLLTTLMLMEQLLYIIEFIHSKNLIHRDIKPDNFLIGTGKNVNKIYAIDFGLSKKYRDSKTGLHIPYRDGKHLVGTARYASINNHLGIEQSRRDDIESLGYMMVYFLKGNLPWFGLVNPDSNKKFDRIAKVKTETKLETLCAGLPKEIITFIQYARNMKFEDKPNYSYLRSLMRKIASKNEFKFDYNKYDWIVNNINKVSK